MSALNLKTVQATKESSPPEDKKIERVTIRFSVFFDGTLNNQANIDARLMTAPKEHLTAEEVVFAKNLKKERSIEEQEHAAEAYNRLGAKKDEDGNSEDENSYEGYYTNVVIMERYIDDAKDYDLTLTTYIEGTGTNSFDDIPAEHMTEPDAYGDQYLALPNGSGDKMLGFAFAEGETSVPIKVEKGLVDVVKKIKASVKKDTIIVKLTLDVFGFSRGAAAARYFIHEALLGDKTIRKRLYDLEYRASDITVNFVGLYDTVATYGIAKVFADRANNTQGLKLYATAYAKRVIQLAAADEHRKYFSLTDIDSAGSKGTEIFLPGAHSDIGGGYRDNGAEEQVLRRNKYNIAGAQPFEEDEGLKDRAQLMAAGWYKDEEITLLHDNMTGHPTVLGVSRQSIANHYSRIPLHLMAGYARESEINILEKIERDEAIPSALIPVRKRIDTYISDTQKSRETDWLFGASCRCSLPCQCTPEWLRKLRHDYLHFSARQNMGHAPRIRDNKRFRRTYAG